MSVGKLSPKHLAWALGNEQSFFVRYSERCVHDPWWSSACDQARAGDPYLIVQLSLRVLQEVCAEFHIPRALGFWSLERYGLRFTQVSLLEDEDEDEEAAP